MLPTLHCEGGTRHPQHALILPCRLYLTRLDELLEEHTLLGTTWACKEALRPMAASSLAELAHHLRHEATTAQLKTIIHIFSRCAPTQ